jgi:hypothetical protein
MSFKTILLHLESESQVTHVLKAVVRLAGQYESHLIGTYIAHPLESYVTHTGQALVTAELIKVHMKGEIERVALLATY